MDVAGDAAAAAGGGDTFAAIVVVAIIWVAFFSWLTVVGWATERRKEREAYYRHETEKRLVDKGAVTAEQLIELRNQEERVRWLRRREGLKLGGLITTAAGIAIVVGLRFVDTGARSVSPVGWIPLGIGLVLLLYVFLLYPDSTNSASGIRSIPSDERRDDRQK